MDIFLAIGILRSMKHLLSLTLVSLSLPLHAADNDGFVSMFNGRDLTGWTNINCAPETWTVKDSAIHCTGRPVGALRTMRHYENFVLEAEWRHLSSGGKAKETARRAPGRAGVSWSAGYRLRVRCPSMVSWPRNVRGQRRIDAGTRKPLISHRVPRLS